MSTGLPYKIFRDFRIPIGGNETFFAAAADYVAKQDDLFIVSYPKCGTTLVQYIVYLLKMNAEPPGCMSEVIALIPFVEQDGFPDTNTTLALKYHLPLRLMRLSEIAKYIYVARNPKDACVSYYHFLKKLPGYNIKNFDKFFEAFVEGQLAYGDFVEHVSEWFEVKDSPNILFITYEMLCSQRKETIQKIASFLGLSSIQDTTIENVVKYSSFEFMKSLEEKDAFMPQYLKNSTHLELKENEVPKLMRRGVVGDWKNYLSDEQSQKMNHYLETNIHLMELWRYNMENH